MWNRIVTCILAAACIALTFVLTRAGGSPAPASSPATVPTSLVPATARSSADDDAVLNQRLKELRFDNVGMQDAITTIADLTKANLYVNWKSLEGAGIDHQAPVKLHLWNVTLGQALKILLEDVGGATTRLAFSMSDGIITITTAEDASRYTDTEIYDIRELMDEIVDVYASRAKGDPKQMKTYQEGIDMLVKSIFDTIVPDSWRDAGGTIGSIREIGGLLIITQTRENHQRIATLLLKIHDALHRHELLPATRAARVGKNG